MTMRVLIIEKEHPADLKAYLAALEQAFDPREVVAIGAASEAEALDRCEECQVVVAKAHSLSADVVARMPKLRWVQSLTTGVDHLRTLPLSNGVLVTSTRGVHGPQMGELAVLLMLALTRQFPAMIRNQAQADWVRWPQPLLDGARLLIVGVGAIGEAIAARANAFGMRVTGASGGRTAAPGFGTIGSYAMLPDLAAEADFVVVVAPYRADTHHLIGAEVFGAMPDTAFLINIARGNVVDEQALVAALRGGAIAGAALDVFSHEPLPRDSPFWKMPNVIVTPHIGGMSDRYASQVMPILIGNLRHFQAGRTGAMINLQ